MLNKTVQCAICGDSMKSITWKHLSKHNLSLNEYIQQFPNSPIKSEYSLWLKKESASNSNANRKGVPRTEEVKQKIKETKQLNPKEAWNKGLSRTKEQNNHLSKVRKEKFELKEIIHWNVGNVTPDSTKQKISKTATLQRRKYSDNSKLIRQRTIQDKKIAGWTNPNTQKFLDKLSEQGLSWFNDRDWLYEQHITNRRTIASICVDLGVHWKNSSKTIRDQLVRFDIPIRYWHQASSSQQKDVEDFIVGLGVNITTRDRQIIKPLELDIYLPDYKLAIEYCGLYWHTTQYKKHNYHKIKYDKCKEIGIRLITLYSDEWLNNRKIVEDKLRNIIGKQTGVKVNGRQCKVYIPTKSEKQHFFNNYHIQGDGPGSITYGLTYNQDVVAMMTFIVKSEEIILNRYATSTNVRGGFSKLLAHFTKNHEWSTIISFADLRWSCGDVYIKERFVLSATLPPDYQYVVGEERIHKFNYRHKYLGNRLANYDPSISETQNTLNNGIFKIYNCGLQRWILTAPT